MMHRRMPTIEEEEKAKNQAAVVRRLLGLISPYRLQIALSMGLVIISAAAQGLGPFLIGRAVDVFITGGDTAGLAMTMLFLAITYLAAMIATRFQIFMISRVGQKLLADLRQRVFDRLESLDLQFLESRQAGDLMSRLVNDIEALNNFFSQALTQMIGAFFALVGIIIAMLLLSWQLGLAVLVMIPMLWFVTRQTSRLAREAFRKTRTTIGDVSANLEEELGGVKVAQSMNRTDENIRRFA